MRRTVAGSALLAVLSPAAGAAGGWAAPAPVTPDGCTGSRFATGPDGLPRGFTACEAHLGFVSGRGRSWTTTKAAAATGMVLAVADDGTATYALVGGNDPRPGLHLVKRTRGGRVTTQLLTSFGQVWDYGASLVAKDGTWWAVWAEPNPDYGHEVRFYQAKTMGGTQARTPIVVDDYYNKQPSLALRPGGGVLLAWRKETTTSIGDVWMGESRGGAWTMRKQIPKVTMPILASSGSRVMLLYTPWLGGCAPCPLRYVESRDGRSFGPPHEFTAKFRRLNQAQEPVIASSDGRTFVAFTSPVGREHEGAYAAVVAERRAGTWTETKAVTGQYAVGDLTAAGGTARVFLRGTAVKQDSVSTRVFAQPAPAPVPKPAPKSTSSPPAAAPTPDATTSPTPSPSPSTARPTGSETVATAVTAASSGRPVAPFAGVAAVLAGGATAAVLVRRRRRTS